MDLPILIPVVRALRSALRGTIVEEVRQDDDRFRFVFVAQDDTPRSLVISIAPHRPWIGRPASRSARRVLSPTHAEAMLRRQLKGLQLVDMFLADGDRVITLRFADGQTLVAELVPHRANLIVVGSDGAVRGWARRPRSAASRLVEGQPYAPAPRPRTPDARSLSAGEIDERVGERRREGLELQAALERAVFGIGVETARLVIEEAGRTGRSAGTVLARRLDPVEVDRLEPLVLAAEDPRQATAGEHVDRSSLRLLPWTTDPDSDLPGLAPFRGPDAAGTVGMYHELLDQIEARGERVKALHALLADEERRIRSALERARADLAGFEDSEVHRLRGEALLAGLSRAVRCGDVVRVPDPYSLDDAEIAIPVRPGLPLTACAAECFRLHRRALRGREHALARQGSLEARLVRLGRIASAATSEEPAALDRVEQQLRQIGLPIEPPRSSRRSAPPPTRRAAGVRTFLAPGGSTVLAGRSGPGNDRVTFRLATADDFWLHAQGVSGAHVVLRGRPGAAEPDPDALRFAAGIAAWYSDARGEAAVDVQWTRRKFVRKKRAAPAGTVILKKFQVIRVRPSTPVEL